MKRTPHLTAIGAAIVLLAGCASPTVDKRVSDATQQVKPALQHSARALPQTPSMRGTPEEADVLAQQQTSGPVARRATRPWVGARTVAVQSDERLPPVFLERYTFDFDDRATGGRVPLELVAERIYRITNVPVRIAGDVHAGSSAATSAAAAPPAASGPGAGLTLPQPGHSVRSGQQLPPLPPVGGKETTRGGDLNDKNIGIGAVTQLQPTDLAAIEMRWKGRDMVSFLNTITDRLGLSWSYRDGVVMIHRYVTESFEVAAFGSTQDYSITMTGSSSGTAGQGGGAGGGSSASLNVTETGKVAAVQSMLKAVEKMLANTPGSSVALSEGTNRLTVTTTKDMMRSIRSYVKQEQEAMSRQVMIQIDIYSLTSSASNDAGASLQVLFENLSKVYNVSFSGPPTDLSSTAGGVLMNILSQGAGGNADSNTVSRFGNSAVMLQALYQNGIVVSHQPINMIALNQQWARKTNLRQVGYLSETTPSTVAGAGSGAPGLKTSTITTGDRFMVQPAVLDSGKIMLKFGVSLTSLLGLFDVSTGSGATLQKVQTPEISGTDDQSTVVLRAGETMVLTGLSRIKASTDNRSLAEGAPALLGGTVKGQHVREDFVIFVRPVVL